MSLRLTCEVLFCKRTRGQRKGEPPITGGEEWVCGDHWRGVRLETRRRFQKLRRAAKADPTERNLGRSWLAWCACKREAIEKAAGL